MTYGWFVPGRFASVFEAGMVVIYAGYSKTVNAGVEAVKEYLGLDIGIVSLGYGI